MAVSTITAIATNAPFIVPIGINRRQAPPRLCPKLSHLRFKGMYQLHQRTEKINGDRNLAPLLQHHERARKSHLHSQESPSDDSSTKSSSVKDIIVIVSPLLLVYVSNQLSRFSICYLVDFSTTSKSSSIPVGNAFNSMNIDLGFSENQYGLLASTAFTILFALSSLIAGYMADKYDRKLLTLTSCFVWSIATLTQSVSHSFQDVLVARLIMGGACAFAAPAAYTLIADRISEERAALANSIYASGVYLGGALASLTLFLDFKIGWRGALGMVGWFGIFSTLFSAVMLPDDRERNQLRVENDDPTDSRSTTSSMMNSAIEIVSIPRLRYLYIAAFFRFSAGLIIAVWAAPYYKQAFPENISDYAIVNAFIKGAIGLSSGILGGSLAEILRSWMKSRMIKSTNEVVSVLDEYFDEDSIQLLLPIMSSLLAIPTFYLATHSSHSFEISMVWLAVEYLVAECWFGPTIAVMQSTVDASNRGAAQGIFVLSGALANISPTILGWVHGNNHAQLQLDDILCIGVCGGYFMSSLLFALSIGKKKKTK